MDYMHDVKHVHDKDHVHLKDHEHDINNAFWYRCVKWAGHPELLVHKDQFSCGGYPVGGLQHHDLWRPQDLVT